MICWLVFVPTPNTTVRKIPALSHRFESHAWLRTASRVRVYGAKEVERQHLHQRVLGALFQVEMEPHLRGMRAPQLQSLQPWLT